ncbi:MULTISPECIES: papain-like cysteine protease family protein [unclassified Massilia]|uniref:papain-like cysteine protease family protein n=1 Tax=unclassified Massilia TaxID=2609279 RepID=UPI00177D73B6|nr:MULTISPECIES: papain-like cysteine protease family protein [unclassified Massilia]MBD8532139.1 hypothetical protein [Massilia sp. CFBP 13647]MBD8675603.1 hypothetical protein [Massilia sp. CFBP 13721]
MFYVVPDMKLIPQDKDWSCWYASGQMLIDWRRRQTRSTEAAHPDPSQAERWGKLYDKASGPEGGIRNEDILQFARDLGLEAIAPMSPTPAGIEKWLIRYGPLWVNGVSHITVIAGIRDLNMDTEVLVFDPALPHKRQGEWRSLRDWYVLDGRSGRDSNEAVQTVFLHLPSTSQGNFLANILSTVTN